MELGAIKYLSNFHHCLVHSESNFNLVAKLSLNNCFDSRISCVTLLRKFLNLVQCIGRLVCFALLLALLCFLMCLLIKVVIQGGSDGLIVMPLLGIHISVMDCRCSIKFSQYV